MLIILEGPDLAGKSTLAGNLVTQLAARYSGIVQSMHRSVPTMHPLDEYVTPLLEYRPRENEHIVCDRWHLGEVVYPIVKRRKSSMTLGTLAYVENFLKSRGAMIMIINPPELTLLERLAQRGDDFVTEDELLHVRSTFSAVSATAYYERYVQFMPSVDTALASARATEDRATPTRWVTYVGPRVPQVLLVGDERNCLGGNQCTHRPSWDKTGDAVHSTLGPAFMPYPSTSGFFLTNAVHRQLRDEHWGLANACDVDDILAMWRELYEPKVVALGVRAAEKLEDLGIPHGSVPHPQFMRRFYHRYMGIYGETIERVAHSQEKAISWRP